MDRIFMEEALKEAEKAYKKMEVPIGAVIVHRGQIIGRGHNQVESLKDPTAHAEILAIKEASSYLNAWRLLDTSIYVSLEPCAMCAGAIVRSRIKRLVIGTRDPKRGCCGTVENLTNHPSFNHQVEVDFGVLEEEASFILSDFFRKLRENKKY